MSKFKQVFDQGTNGVAIDIANSAGPNSTAFAAITAGFLFSSIQKAHGALSMQLPVTSAALQWRWATGGTRKLSLVMYRWAADAAVGDHQMIRVTNSSDDSTAFTLLLNGVNRLRLNSKAGTVWTAAAANPLNQWIRYEIELTQGVANNDGIIHFAYYAADSLVPIEEVTLNAQNLGGNISDLGNVRGGKVGNDTYPGITYHDSIEMRTGADSTGFIGPYTEPLPTPVVTLGAATRPSGVGEDDATQIVTWPAVAGATAYSAWLAVGNTPAQGDFVKVGATVTSPYTFTGLSAGPYAFGIEARP